MSHEIERLLSRAELENAGSASKTQGRLSTGAGAAAASVGEGIEKSRGEGSETKVDVDQDSSDNVSVEGDESEEPVPGVDAELEEGVGEAVSDGGGTAAGTAPTPRGAGRWPEPVDAGDRGVVLPESHAAVREAVQEASAIRVCLVTWNMHGKDPPPSLEGFLPTNVYHLVAVCTQECQNSIAKSMVFTSKAKWEALMDRTLGKHYVRIRSHTLQAINMLLFAHAAILPWVSDVQSQAVATGVAGKLGNKGGIGVCLRVGTTSLLFVGAHFAAHQNRVAKRNSNYAAIEQGIRIPITASTAPLEGQSRASDRFDRCFWFGDLNYRVNGTRRAIDACLAADFHEVLWHNDQLQREMRRGAVFPGFVEGPVTFRPTYKLDAGTLNYDSSRKQRVPSWTDRVLYRPTGATLLSYVANADVRHSDHLPVLASFAVEVALPDQVGPTELSRGRSEVEWRGQKQSEVCAVQ
mmetsp:Transcript_6057/g.19285  ORF Transcript_6057/g.19285 Transcript_6057/m.19285 type:complete len:465 (+) Transcript_6057:46-1440(+)